MKKAIRLLIADDHHIVRKGIKVLLATEKDMQVIGEAENGVEAVEKAATLDPDVILMDIMMPEMDGIEATRRITAERPESLILVLTSFAADDKVFPAGFRLEQAQKSGGLGLRGMRERVQRISGSLSVNSMPAGGTRVSVTAPAAQT